MGERIERRPAHASASRRTLRSAGLVVACWTALGLLFAPQTYFINLASPTPLSWGKAVVATLLLFYVWGALTPPVLWLGRRFPIERRHLTRNLTILFLAGLPCAAVHMALLTVANRLLIRSWGGYEPPISPEAILVGLGATDVMLYWGILAVSQAVNNLRRYREKELGLVEAQLQLLKMQLNPHFLFNTLNAISELVYEDPEKADATVTMLAELLRVSVKGDRAQEITLRAELELLERYLAIQRTLLEDRLVVRWQIADEALDAYVPNMILQPLVENAIVHGIAPLVSGGSVEVVARRENGSLLLRVADDGRGAADGAAETTGIGLANTRARLRHLYGEAHELELAAPSDGGFEVTVRIPFRERDVEGEDEASYVGRR